jgi:hypothetical protein
MPDASCIRALAEEAPNRVRWGPDDKLGALNLLSIEPFRIPFGTGSVGNPLAIF